MAHCTIRNDIQPGPGDISVFPIDKLNIDVFTLILQEIIDEEAYMCMALPRRLVERPRAAMTLALVCKKWKTIVYSTPSFWPIISLCMFQSVDRMQAKLDRLAERAMNAPVNLTLMRFHADHDMEGTGGHSSDCCCKSGYNKIRLDFAKLSHVRRLRIEAIRTTGLVFIDPVTFPFLKNVKELQLFPGQSRGETPKLDLNNFLRYTPQIEDLYLGWIRECDISWCQRGEALMPNLRTLSVAGGGLPEPDGLPRLAKFLSHAPNLQELTTRCFDYETGTPIPVELSKSLNSLPHLRKIDTEGFIAVDWLFNKAGIQIPRLREFAYRERNHKGDGGEFKKFFSSHQSVKKIHLKIESAYPFEQSLFWAPCIEELTIEADPPGRGLIPLYSPIMDEKTGLWSYACPNLRIITILTIGEGLYPPFFEELVRVRCQPINESGHTSAGCKAVKSLILKGFINRNSKDSPVFATEAWKKAQVWRVVDRMSELGSYHPRWSYYLRWPYNPEQTS